MRLFSVSQLGFLLAVTFGVMAEDLLFITTLYGSEKTQAMAAGYTIKEVSAAQFQAMSTIEIATYKALIIGDPFCNSAVINNHILDPTKLIWSAAITGNIVLIGTDPSFHFTNGRPGAGRLETNTINFAAGQAGKTGMYMALSCVGGIGNVDILSYFGTFTLGSPAGSYNAAHIVASSPALGTLADGDVSNWSASVHEVFTAFPSSGPFPFVPLAIASGATGTGSMTFGDGTSGIPYILALGATPAGCGDGILSKAIGEECDDSNKVSGDGCSSACKCEFGKPGRTGCDAPVCGDGYYAPASGEQCDDGNTASGDGCSSTCKCETGAPDGKGGCLASTCGDGVFDSSKEQCDDSNTVSGDGCSSTCTCENGLSDGDGGCKSPVCGDGVFYPASEQCDDGNEISGDGCSSSCKCETGAPDGKGGCLASVCGDGVFDSSKEQCDDSNTVSGDGCSSTCICEVGLPDGSGGCLPPACGDGIFDPKSGEKCDDGNKISGDGCSATCTCENGLPDNEGGCKAPACGDGVYYSDSEECDDSNTVSGDGCSSTCKCERGLPDGIGGCKPPVCGDSIFDPTSGEQCDDGNSADGDGCSSTCKCETGLPDNSGGCLASKCGDGVFDSSKEQCDDSNIASGDGCSSTCQCEYGLPNGSGGCLPPACGDGVFNSETEECDPGIVDVGSSACSDTCTCLVGKPDGEGKCLPSRCGDGVFDKEKESCDDGNEENGDGCSSSCLCEDGAPDGEGGCDAPKCGDKIYQPELDEECDGGLGCSATCQCDFSKPDGKGGCLPPVCGDGFFQPAMGEECDDGNLLNGDGCSSTCECEVGFIPDGSGKCDESIDSGTSSSPPSSESTSEDPIAGPTSTEPIIDPVASATSMEPVVDPVASATSIEPVADPVASATSEPIVDSVASATSVEPIDPAATSASPPNPPDTKIPFFFSVTMTGQAGVEGRAPTSQYLLVNADGTMAPTSSCESATLLVWELSKITHNSATAAFATAGDIAAGSGLLTFGAPATGRISTTFSLSGSLVVWTNALFGNTAGAIFALNPATNRIEVFYNGMPPANYKIVTMTIVSVDTSVIESCNVIAPAPAGPTTTSRKNPPTTTRKAATTTKKAPTTTKKAATTTPKASLTTKKSIPPVPALVTSTQVEIVIGIEVIIQVEITTTSYIVDGAFVTSVYTSECGTTINPIYNKPVSGFACYVCQMMSEGIACPTSEPFTVTTVACSDCPGGVLPTPEPIVYKTCSSCELSTMAGNPSTLGSASPIPAQVMTKPMTMPMYQPPVQTAPATTTFETSAPKTYVTPVITGSPIQYKGAAASYAAHGVKYFFTAAAAWILVPAALLGLF